jgi:hypothetical protein
MAAPQFVPPPIAQPFRAPPSKLTQVPTLGTLLIVHGVLVLIWALFCVLAIAIGAINVGFLGAGKDEDYIVIVAYTVFAAGALPVAILEIVAGMRMRSLRSRNLAFVALFASVASFFCGNVFCLPLSLGLGVWGLLVLLDRSVIDGFARVAAGEDAGAVLADASR